MRSVNFTFLWRSIAFIAITATTVLGGTAPASAFDYFEFKNDYYGQKYGVPDFTFTRSEFGGSAWAQDVHLGLESIVEHIKGATVVYNAAKNEVKVYVNGGATYSEPTQTTSTMETCGPGHWFIQTVGTNPDNNKWCTPAHLVGNSGGPAYSHTIPGVARSCTFEVNSKHSHEHSC